MKAVLFPNKETDLVEELELPDSPSDQLESIRRLTGGGKLHMYAIPKQLVGGKNTVAYVNADGRYTYRGTVNYRATLFMSPGLGLVSGDYIAGPMVVIGYDPRTAKHVDAPKSVVERIVKILNS